jgi:hypothetical protein
MANYKAEAIVRDLVQKLKMRLGSTWAITQTTDSLTGFNGKNPVLKISRVADGTWTTAEEYAYIRIKGEDTIQEDVVGLTQRVYAPHVCQIVTEATAGGDSTMKAANLFPIICTIANYGMKMELYHSEATKEPAEAEIKPANLKATFTPDLYHPLTSQI